MQPKIAIYLAGSIQKEHSKQETSFWTSHDLEMLRENLSDYELSFLNPAFRTDDLTNQRAVFGRDMTQVFCSDVVFVDARDRRGIGVGAEMMWAKINQIPVITWAPKNSHYNKTETTVLGIEIENFIHPFIESLSDKIVTSLVEGAEWIDMAMNDPSLPIKSLEDIGDAMQYYKRTQLAYDEPMQDLLICDDLRRRLNWPTPRIAVHKTCCG